MYKTKYILTFIIGLLHFTGYAQPSPFGQKTKLASGYEKTQSGETLTYTSAFPDYIDQSLLTRATDGTKTIEWQTSKPMLSPDGYYYFRWIAGHATGTSGGVRHFDFYINGQKKLTISTQPGNKAKGWSFGAPDSTRITFVRTRTDAANDAHGFAYLRVPASLVKNNQPLILKIVGQPQNSPDWMMIFKYNFEEKADLALYPFLYKNGKQPLKINVLHFGKEVKMEVRINHKKQGNFRLKDGMNSFELPVDPVKKTDSLHVFVQYGKTILSNGKVVITPIVHREIDFIHHSHTDIGYSHLQPEVERIHTKDVYDALRMIDKTKNYPAEAKFKWNIESLWVVENFLRDASPTDRQRFFTAVKQDDIGLSAMYANILTGLSMPEEMLHYTDYAQLLKSKYQLPINSAMMSDVPGFSNALVTGLAKSGVKYFSSGPNYLGVNNPYLGDRVGEFVRAWGDKPVYWASPSGQEKVLFWAGGKGYSSWHGNAPGAIFDNGPKKIAQYMDELASKNYPYEMVQWRYNCVADNAPIDSLISDFVKSWNEKYSSPKIVLTTVNELFTRFEAKYGAQLQTIKGDITPYWEDGAASTATEEGANRANSLRLQQLTTLYSIINPAQYNEDQFYSAWRNTLMFHEHTWGAHNSIAKPDSPFVTEQWRIKRDFMVNGTRDIKAIADKLLPALDNVNNGFAVVNTLSWSRGGAVYLPAGFVGNAVTDGAGRVFPLQQLADGRKLFLADGLAPLSVTYFRPSHLNRRVQTQLSLRENTLTNGRLTLNLDKKLGDIRQLQNIEGYSFVGDFGERGLNAYWYVPGQDPAKAQSSQPALMKTVEQGPLLTTVAFTATAPGAKQVTQKISLFANDDKVYIENTIDKSKVLEKEAVYFAFPFEQGMLNMSADGGFGTVNYIKDQLPGSNYDFFSAKRWVDFADVNKGVQLMMVEPFMVSPAMVDERLLIKNHKKWEDTARVTANWFSYVMNNYWHTNYKASQEGVAKFRYVLRPHGKVKNFEQERQAMEFNQPLLVINQSSSPQKSLFALSNPKLVVTSITPKGNGQLLLRLFNPEVDMQQTTIHWQSLQPLQLNKVANNQSLSLQQPISLVGNELLEILIRY